MVNNGPKKYPGANYITSLRFNNFHINPTENYNLYNLNNTKKSIKKYILRPVNIQIGDIIERHLLDTDIILFNRQPSLHRVSIMAHKARIMKWKTFRLNECVCTPYNADFDGDEMNIHVLQTYEARAEALVLMGVKNNLCTPRSLEPLVAAIQDFISAFYILSLPSTIIVPSLFNNIYSSITTTNTQHKNKDSILY